MVPLFLKFFSFQRGQILNLIEIVKAVPVVMESEPVGIQALQQIAIIVGQTGEPAGDTTDMGVVDDGINDRLYLPGTQGEQINTALIELGEEYQILPQKSHLLAAPQIEVGEIVFAAPLAAVQQISIVDSLVRKVQLFELDHRITSFTDSIPLF